MVAYLLTKAACEEVWKGEGYVDIGATLLWVLLILVWVLFPVAVLLDLLSIRAGWTTRIPELVESNTVQAFGGDLRLGVSLHEISLTQEVFQKVMGDAQIIDLLRDLDVGVDRGAGASGTHWGQGRSEVHRGQPPTRGAGNPYWPGEPIGRNGGTRGVPEEEAASPGAHSTPQTQ